MDNKKAVRLVEELIGKSLSDDLIIAKASKMMGIKHEVTYGANTATPYGVLRFDLLDISIKRDTEGKITHTICRAYLDEGKKND